MTVEVETQAPEVDAPDASDSSEETLSTFERVKKDRETRKQAASGNTSAPDEEDEETTDDEDQEDETTDGDDEEQGESEEESEDEETDDGDESESEEETDDEASTDDDTSDSPALEFNDDTGAVRLPVNGEIVDLTPDQLQERLELLAKLETDSERFENMNRESGKRYEESKGIRRRNDQLERQVAEFKAEARKGKVESIKIPARPKLPDETLILDKPEEYKALKAQYETDLDTYGTALVDASVQKTMAQIEVTTDPDPVAEVDNSQAKAKVESWHTANEMEDDSRNAVIAEAERLWATEQYTDHVAVLDLALKNIETADAQAESAKSKKREKATRESGKRAKTLQHRRTNGTGVPKKSDPTGGNSTPRGKKTARNAPNSQTRMREIAKLLSEGKDIKEYVSGR